MAAPTFAGQTSQANLGVSTTSTITVGLPTHQADDILVLGVTIWAPNSIPSVNDIPTPSGWSLIGRVNNASGDGQIAYFWKRATSSSETNPTVSRGTGWDTGADTNFAGRVICVRGCETTSTPWDDAELTVMHTAANQAFDPVTVLGADRLVVQFLVEQDNQATGIAPDGWIAQGMASSGTGTDCGFNAFTQVASSDTGSAAPPLAAPAQGGYVYLGISFKPPTTGDNWELPLDDTVTLSDSITGKAVVLGKADTITLSDAFTRTWTVLKSLGDTVTLSDAAGKAVTRPLGDTITLTDNISLVKILLLQLSDTITLSDAVSKRPGLGKSDTVTLTDALTRAWAAIQSFGDTITLSDTAAKHMGLVKADSVTLSDLVQLVKLLTLQLSDTITLTDAASKRPGLSKADQVTLTDNIAKALFRSVADQIVLSDLLVKSFGLSKADALTLTDAVGKSLGKQPSDTITLSDAFDTELGGGGPLAHTLNLADTIQLTDDIARALNGEFLGQGESRLGTILLNKFGLYE